MLRPKGEKDNPQLNFFTRFARIFTMLMTLVYIGLGFLIIFAADTLRLSISNEIRYALGGILILYGVVRFVRAYQRNKSNTEDNGYED